MKTFPELVRILTAVHTETHTVEDEDGKTEVAVETEPLLAMLEQSATGATGSAGGSPPNTRIIIDAPRIELRDRIRRELNADYARLTGRFIFRTLPDLAREWFEVFMEDPLAAEIAEWTEILAGWEREIRDMFDPPVRVEIGVPCFLCKQSQAVTHEDGDTIKKAAVWLEYRREAVSDARLLCKACDEVLAEGKSAVEFTARHAGYSSSESA